MVVCSSNVIMDWRLRAFHINGSQSICKESISRGFQHIWSSEHSMSERSEGKILEVTDQVTLAKIQTSEGELLSQNGIADTLKDICTSFSLFKILRLRYSGNALSQGRTRLLLIREIHRLAESHHERVFRVLEEELAFLYDLLYTKHAVIFQPNRLYLRLLEFLLIVIVSVLLFFEMIQRVGHRCGLFCNAYSYRIDLYVTMSALAVYLIAETWQVMLLAFTRWAKVDCVCMYVKHQLWKKGYLRKRCIEFICRHPSQKPWERKFHQYFLLDSCMYRPCKLLSNPFTYQFMDWYRDGQKEGLPVSLSGDVKEAIVNRLLNLRTSWLENGEASLRKHNVSHFLSYACKFLTQSEVIMVWHIATTICEYTASRPAPEGVKSFHVATSLSRYLAYLVAFEPRLLPDHPAITESLFTETIKEARCELRGYNTESERVHNLYQTNYRPVDSDLGRGTTLAKVLLETTGLSNHKWEILADFWADMTLFVAPSNDIRTHAEKLADGGELLTHLWALLYHAGIERRPVVQPPLELA